MARSANKLEIVDQLNALILYGEAGKISSRQDAVNWADNIASLLKSGDSEYYDPFIEHLSFLSKSDLSPSLQESNLNQMIKIAKQAAFELKYDISRKTRIGVTLPKKMTISWFLHHAPSDFWFWFAVAVLFAFVVGLFAGQIESVRHWLNP